VRLGPDRVVNFISDLKFTGQDILLFGFADEGIGKEVNLKLSKERAQLVAEQFTRRGRTPLVVTGFDDSMSVASSLTEEGKDRIGVSNLWLKK
jgi:outer membrane protein OmpA-like peptidoglycan-associated protein